MSTNFCFEFFIISFVLSFTCSSDTCVSYAVDYGTDFVNIIKNKQIKQERRSNILFYSLKKYHETSWSIFSYSHYEATCSVLIKTEVLIVTVNQVRYPSRLLRIAKKLLTSVKNGFIISHSFFSYFSFPSKCFASLV